METVVQSPPEQLDGPDFLLKVPEPEGARARWRMAGVISLAAHGVLLLVLLSMPAGEVTLIEKPPPPRRVTHLVDPPTRLTQKAPNTAAVTKDITANMTTEAPRTPAPAVLPAPAQRKVLEPPPPAARAQKTPQISVPEPPKIDAAKDAMKGLQALQIPQAPLPQAQKPKLVLETPGASGTAATGGTGRLRMPEASVQEAVRNAARGISGSGTTVGDMMDQSPSASLSPTAGARPRSALQLLSDPNGVDFRPYLLQVLQTVRRNWFAVMPESANLGQRGRVVMQFAVTNNGTISKIVFGEESGAQALDRAAVASLSASNPLPPLPSDFKGDRVVLQFTFLYNIPTR